MGESDLMTQSYHPSSSAHRRRTDLMPTITYNTASPGTGISRASTPGTRMLRSPGRSPSAMSGTDTPGTASVKMRLSGPRRPRPVSIATTGMMSSSMYEKRTSSSNANTPTKPNICGNGFAEKSKSDVRTKKSPLSKSLSTENEDARSNSSSTTSMSKTPRKTPAQVKAESAARKAKSKPNKPKEEKPMIISNTEIDSTSESTTPIPIREATPDIIRKSPVKEVSAPIPAPVSAPTAPEENGDSLEASTKKIIQSEEEAKARLAEKRREMKEKKEREAELERQKQLEAERLEAERKAREEEEERRAMEEAERLAAEARRAEEERLQKAIEEAQKREEEERKKKEEEESKKAEAEKKAKDEAERKQAELDEKLKKEEEERLARKKRLEEIMARTRGAGKSANTTPKKEPQEPQDSNNASNGAPSGDDSVAQTNGETTHSSLDPAGDPTKPDLLGDIDSAVSQHCSDNANSNNGSSEVSNDDLEKGIVDMNISEQTKDEEKLMNVKNESSLLDLDPVPVSLKQPPIEAQPEFDQILDLSNDATSSGPPLATPLIAFEDSITTSPKQEVPTSDLLS